MIPVGGSGGTTRTAFGGAPPTVPGNIIGKKEEKRNFYQLRPSTVKHLQLRHSIGEYLHITLCEWGTALRGTIRGSILHYYSE